MAHKLVPKEPKRAVCLCDFKKLSASTIHRMPSSIDWTNGRVALAALPRAKESRRGVYIQSNVEVRVEKACFLNSKVILLLLKVLDIFEFFSVNAERP